MLCLGIESTAHTFGVSLLDEKRIFSNERAVFTTTEGGMIPREISDHHVSVCADVIKRALNKRKPELIAFSQGPGIGHALRVGAVAARTMAIRFKAPIVGVNHCVAHLEIAKRFTGFKDPIMLYVSGGNTQVIGFETGRYRVFGETLDIGVGNLLDVFGRKIGLGFPAGPAIEKLARKGRRYIPLPYSIKGMDVSFTGMLTFLKSRLKKHKKEDLCHSLQETAFAMLVEVSERAMAHTKKDELVVTGGVAANERLQEMCQIMCEERGASYQPIPKEYCVDNAAMIAHNGLLMYSAGTKNRLSDTAIMQRWRTDDLDVNWTTKH
jgi:N6-L-threonylcarbamoyladenine synthase